MSLNLPKDGSYLAELLLNKGYEVHGLIRRVSQDNLQNIEHMEDKLILHYGDLETDNHITTLIAKYQFDEIYNMASQSQVRISFDIPEYTGNVTGLGVTRILESIRHLSPKTKLLQASSSEMFGNSLDNKPLNEQSPMNPTSPYACAKLYAYNMCKIYRKAYNLFICNSIAFNHESPKRGENFVSRKISQGVAKIKLGLAEKITLGNINAERDWGYAPDYVEGMYLMMQQDRPDDYVLATGKSHSIKDFLRLAFKEIGISDYKNYIEINDNLKRPSELYKLVGDYTKAKIFLNWSPKVSFEELVKIMVQKDLEKLKNGNVSKGKKI